MPGANSNQLIQFQLGGQIIGSNNVLTQVSDLATDDAATVVPTAAAAVDENGSDTMTERSGMLQYAIFTQLLLRQRHGGGDGMTA